MCSTWVPLSPSMPPILRSTMSRWGTEMNRKPKRQKEAFRSKESGSRGSRRGCGLLTRRSGGVWDKGSENAPSLTPHPHLLGSRLAEPGVFPAPSCSLEQDPGLLRGAASGGGVWESGSPDGTSANGCVLLQGSFGVQGCPFPNSSLSVPSVPEWSFGIGEDSFG